MGTSFFEAEKVAEKAEHGLHGHHQEQQFDPSYEPDIPAEIDARNGWTDLQLPADLQRNRDFQAAVDLLAALIFWLANSGSITSAGRRCFTLCYVLRPGMFPARSMKAMAENLGTTKQSLSKYTSEIVNLSRGLFQTPLCRGQAFRASRRASAIRAHRISGA